MNANTKKPQMKHFPCPKYIMIYRTYMYNYSSIKKKHLKNGQKLKFTFQNMPLLNNLQYQHCSKMLDGPE